MTAIAIQQAFETALQHHQTGRLAEAEALYRQILAVQPNHADALHLLGVIALQMNRYDVAIDLIQRALTVNPIYPAALNNLGLAFHAMRRFEEACGAFTRAIELSPGFAEAHSNLGKALLEMGRQVDAVIEYQRAVALNPNFSQAHHNLGLAARGLGKFEEAISHFRRALACQPSCVDAQASLAETLLAIGRRDEALSEFRKALVLQPHSAATHYNMGIALMEARELDQAVAAYRRALELDPGYVDAFNNLGCALRMQKRFDEAARALRQAIALCPEAASAWGNLGNVFIDQGRFEEAIDILRQALAREASFAAAHNSLAIALTYSGRPQEAGEAYRRAISLAPSSMRFHSDYLVGLHYLPGITGDRLFQAHGEFDEAHLAPWRARQRPHSNAADARRPLRIGFVSPHFATHPAGNFLVRPLEHLDPAEFRVYCYSDTEKEDPLTERLRQRAAVWRQTIRLTDEQLDEQIYVDEIDILFDLAGHTPGNRLPVFARKPAPIQITWLDYVGTTGLGAMDYILADARQIPPGGEGAYREKVIRMPDDYICFDPPAHAPEVNPLPALTARHVTFGSFNFLAKINSQVIETWARILHSVAGSRLVLKNKGFDEEATRKRIREMFAGYGIAGERLEFLGWSPPAEVPACYQRVDIALDTFPYNGGLTTCEALWMGVPVVSLAGETFAGRHGYSHLHTAGLPEMVTASLDEYVTLAVAVAADLPRLAKLRAELREKVARSPLCDGPRFAAHFSRLLREVWERWCTDQAVGR